jgi:HSP20 family protein
VNPYTNEVVRAEAGKTLDTGVVKPRCTGKNIHEERRTKMIVAIEPLDQTDRATENTSGTAGKRTMPMDAYRDGDQLIVQFDLPGIDPDSVELNVENNVLRVKARRPRPQIEDSQWLVSERLHGTFSCELHLSDGLNLDKIQANYEQGVLTLRIPVAEESKPRRIEIGGSDTSGARTAAS